MDENFLQQVFAELVDANEQAFAVLANAIADVTPGFGRALAARAQQAKAAFDHPMRDRFVGTAVRAVEKR